MNVALLKQSPFFVYNLLNYFCLEGRCRDEADQTVLHVLSFRLFGVHDSFCQLGIPFS